MVVLFKEDFSDTQLVGEKLTGWGAGFIHSPESISFVQDPLNPDNRVLQVRKGGIGTDRATEIAMYRTEREFWARTKIFFPDDFHLTASNKWFNPLDFMFEYVDGQNTMVFPPIIWGDNLHLMFKRQKVENGVSVWLEYDDSGIYLQRGRWHTFAFHIIRDKVNGLVENFVDGIKVHEYRGETFLSREQFNYIPIKHYCDANESVNSVLYDDVMIATTKADLTVTPEPEKPEPSGDSRFLYWSLLGAFGIVLIILLANSGTKKSD